VTSPVRSQFRELRRVFAGYLHEDFVVEHGTPDAALRAFLVDASVAERRRFSREVSRFLEETSALPMEDVRNLLARMGSRWAPASRDALVRTLQTAARQSH